MSGGGLHGRRRQQQDAGGPGGGFRRGFLLSLPPAGNNKGVASEKTKDDAVARGATAAPPTNHSTSLGRRWSPSSTGRVREKDDDHDPSSSTARRRAAANAAAATLPTTRTSTSSVLLELEDDGAPPLQEPASSPAAFVLGEEELDPARLPPALTVTTTTTARPNPAASPPWLLSSSSEEEDHAAAAGPEAADGVGDDGDGDHGDGDEGASPEESIQSGPSPLHPPPSNSPASSDFSCFQAALAKEAAAAPHRRGRRRPLLCPSDSEDHEPESGRDGSDRWDRFVRAHVVVAATSDMCRRRRWAWEACCQDPHRRSWRRRLGLALLRHQPILPPLPAVLDWLEAVQDREPFTASFPALADAALPWLADAVAAAGPRRTVRAQRAVEAAIRLADATAAAAASASAGSTSGGEPSRRREELQDAAVRAGPFLDRLWDAQRIWYAGIPQGSEGGTESATPQDRDRHPTSGAIIGRAQTRCRVAVANEWKRIYSEFIKAGDREWAAKLWVADLRGCTTPFEPSGDEFIDGLGGLAQTMGLAATSATCGSMETALSSVHSATPLNDTEVRRVWRGILAWLGQKRSHLQKFPDDRARLLSRSIDCYSQLNSLPTVSLAATVIEILWGAAAGAYSDDEKTLTIHSETIPSIDKLLEALPHASGIDKKIRHRHAALVATAIAVSGSDVSVLQTQPEHLAVDVLAHLLRAPAGNGGNSSSRCDAAARLLLSKFAVWSTVPRLMADDSALFLACSPSIVQDVIALALKQHGEWEVGVLLRSLVCVLLHSPVEVQCSLVSNLIDALVREDDQRQNDPEATVSPVSSFCRALGPQWRLGLLEASPEPFALALVGIGKEMLRRPAHLVPLTLFGSLIGGPKDYVDDSCHVPHMSRAAVQLLELALSCLRTSFLPSTNHTPVNPTLARLSPLLLLRRVPTLFYRTLRSHEDTEHAEANSHFNDLIHEMSLRLGLKASNENFVPEERRLAAEICAMALPMEALFRSLFEPTFSSLLPKPVGAVLKPTAIKYTNRAARAVLYSVCHKLSILGDDENGMALLRVSAMVLSLLRYYSLGSQAESEEILQLQAGCVDFLALCLHRLVASSAFKHDCVNPVVSTFGFSPDCHEDLKLLEALHLLYQTMIDIVCEGSDWVVARTVDVDESTHSKRGRFSVAVRVMVWKTFYLCGNRCSPDMQCLQRFLKSVVPWVVEWGSAGTMDSDIRHPLCISAALQVVLLVSAPFAPSPDRITSSLNNVVLNKVLTWSMSIVSIQHDMVGQVEGVREARTCALKLLLFLLASFAHAGDKCRILSEQQVFEIIGVLESLSGEDQDSELRFLAKQVIDLLC